MNPIPLHLANGLAFFESIAAVVAALLLLLFVKSRIARSALRIVILVGLIVVFCSSTPLPLWLQGIWIALSFACMILFQPGTYKRSTPYAIVLVLFSAALCIAEARHRVLPRITIDSQRKIYVIGDSITAGVGAHETLWPEMLAQSTHLDITNLAQPGATLKSAIHQADGITTSHAMVILEIGGNDLLGGMKGSLFRTQLDALLAKLQSRDCSIVMFELPLLPLNNGIGEAQRSLAERYHATLIPKRCLAAVIGADGNTMDGLHLSPAGHAALAKTVQDLLSLR